MSGISGNEFELVKANNCQIEIESCFEIEYLGLVKAIKNIIVALVLIIISTILTAIASYQFFMSTPDLEI